MRASAAVLALATASLVAGLDAAAVPTAAPTAAPTVSSRRSLQVTGAFSKPKAPTNETISLLIQALSKPYKATPHVCVSKVFAYETAVVAGVAYRFHVRGAEITATQTFGWCAPTNASLQPVKANQNFSVIVVEQPWLNVLEAVVVSKE